MLAFYVEALEQRRLLAGVVTVQVQSGGDVFIRGDNESNQIELIDTSDDILLVGLNGTQVRVPGGPVTDRLVIPNGSRDVEGDLRIDMRGGDDAVSTSAVDVIGDLQVRLGSGDDVFEFSAASTLGDIVGKNALIDSGAGSDMIRLRMDTVQNLRVELKGSGRNDFLADLLTVQNDFRLRGRGAQDWVDLEGNVAIEGNVLITTAAAQDVVRIRENVEIEGDLTVDLGSNPRCDSGNDFEVFFVREMDEREFRGDVTIRSGAGCQWVLWQAGHAIGGKLEISTGGARDMVDFGSGELIHGLDVNTGGGNDLVSMNTIDLEGETYIATGGGADSVQLYRTRVAGELTIQTGAGDDTLFMRESDFHDEVAVAMGGGSDQASLRTIQDDGVAVDLGGGADDLWLTDVVSTGTSLFRGGSGFDRLRSNDHTVQPPFVAEITGFEEVPTIGPGG